MLVFSQDVEVTSYPLDGFTMAVRPVKPAPEQIDAAIHRAAEAARAVTRSPDRITMVPVPPTDDDLVDERFWFIRGIVVVAESEEWSVFYDPTTTEERLRVRDERDR
jgi:hypothetical protein